MAKEPETVDHFRLTINRLTPQQLGVVIADLAKREIFDIRPELITDVVTFNRKTSHAVKAEDFLIDWMADHPEFRARDAIAHFREAGRTDGSGHTALRVLCEKKLLRKLGEGRYSAIAVKHQPKGLKAARKAAAKQTRHEVDHRTFILRTASRNHSRFNTAWMKKQFTADGRKWAAVSPTIAALLKRKLIKRVAESEYVLLEKAKKAAKKKPVTNGAFIPEVVEAAHG
jgi:hypothetical protein